MKTVSANHLCCPRTVTVLVGPVRLRRFVPNAALLTLLLAVLLTQCSAADLPGGETYGWGASEVWRFADNSVRLYSASWVTGDDFWDWTAVVQNATGYRDGSVIDGPHTVVQQMLYWPIAESWRTFTLSEQGVGSYRRTALHRAYHYFWGSYYIGPTDVSQLISRPTVYRDGPQPFYLGGSATSGTYVNSTTFRSDPMGAVSTPYWFFVAGSGYGTLIPSNSTSPTYTVTQRSSGCHNYDVVIRASYGGLQTDSFWIFNDSPTNLHDLATEPVYNVEGWQTNKRLKVRDMCGGGMRWVAVNETFENPAFVFPEPVQGWDLFDWPWGVWATEDKFNAWGDFLDIIYELRVDGKSPQPMNTGTNGNSEADQHTVMRATQKFFAASPTIQVQQNSQVHYLDHGAHK